MTRRRERNRKIRIKHRSNSYKKTRIAEIGDEKDVSGNGKVHNERIRFR